LGAFVIVEYTAQNVLCRTDCQSPWLGEGNMGIGCGKT
jgi:hypothetical protein